MGDTQQWLIWLLDQRSVSPMWQRKSVPGHAAVDRHCPEFPVGIEFGEALLGKA